MTNVMPEGLIWPQFEDGTPVNIGDYVVDECGREVRIEVIRFSHDGCWLIGDLAHYVAIFNNGEKCKRPFNDSWEKLEEDAKKYVYDYWNCNTYRCQECPSEIDGKTPNKYYDCDSCSTAARIDVTIRAKKIAEHERNQ